MRCYTQHFRATILEGILFNVRHYTHVNEAKTFPFLQRRFLIHIMANAMVYGTGRVDIHFQTMPFTFDGVMPFDVATFGRMDIHL